VIGELAALMGDMQRSLGALDDRCRALEGQVRAVVLSKEVGYLATAD
jgi:hypothetical protein